MCCIISLATYALDFLQRVITACLGLLLCVVVALGLVVAVTAGIAYGYNYSMSEFLTYKREKLTVYLRAAFPRDDALFANKSYPVGLSETDFNETLDSYDELLSETKFNTSSTISGQLDKISKRISSEHKSKDIFTNAAAKGDKDILRVGSLIQATSPLQIKLTTKKINDIKNEARPSQEKFSDKSLLGLANMNKPKDTLGTIDNKLRDKFMVKVKGKSAEKSTAANWKTVMQLSVTTKLVKATAALKQTTRSFPQTVPKDESKAKAKVVNKNTAATRLADSTKYAMTMPRLTTPKGSRRVLPKTSVDEDADAPSDDYEYDDEQISIPV